MIVRFLEKKCMQLFRTKSLISCREICRQQQEKHLILCFTRDGQLCDLIIDRATLEAMLEAGKKSGEKIIEEYAQTAVAIADIKIAVRSQKTGKNADFMHCVYHRLHLNAGVIIK